MFMLQFVCFDVICEQCCVLMGVSLLVCNEVCWTYGKSQQSKRSAESWE